VLYLFLVGEMEKLSMSLECPVCFQTLKDPRILPCAHTFCKKCVVAICEGLREIRCPVYVQHSEGMHVCICLHLI
jgi:RING-type zinc-finger